MSTENALAKVSEKVFNVMKGFGYIIKMYDKDGNQTITPAAAIRFFIVQPNMMVSIDDQEIKVSKSLQVDNKDIERFTRLIKNIANENLMNYTLKVFGKKIMPKDFAYQTKSDEAIEESLGKLHGFTKTSYQQLGEVRLTYRHRTPVNEQVPSSRIHNIRSITLEHNGNFFHYPVVHVDGARALARHINEKGQFSDDISTIIVETSIRFTKLKEFQKYIKSNKLVTESNISLLESIYKKMSTIKENLRNFIFEGNYEELTYFLANESQQYDSSKVEQLRDRFTIKKFDEQFQDILPLLGNIITEREKYEAELLEEIKNEIWINSVPATTGLTFENNDSKLRFFVNELRTVFENQKIKTFFEGVSDKLNKNKSMSRFETGLVKEVMKKVKVKKSAPSKAGTLQTKLEESIQKIYLNKLIESKFAIRPLGTSREHLLEMPYHTIEELKNAISSENGDLSGIASFIQAYYGSNQGHIEVHNVHIVNDGDSWMDCEASITMVDSIRKRVEERTIHFKIMTDYD
jgi:hypothetical protein